MLDNTQQDILTGLMLGDGHLEIHSHGKNACLKIQRKSTDRKYLFYTASIFEELLTTKPIDERKVFDKRTNKFYYATVMRTKCDPLLTEYHNKWYVDKVKTIPNNLELNPFSLAIWFCDDGCVTRISAHSLECKFSTDGFTKDETYFLRDKLDNYFNCKNFRVYQNGNGYQIRCFGYYSKLVFREIDGVFPDSMSRKSSVWRLPEYKTFEDKPIYTCKFCLGNNLYRNGSSEGTQKLLCKDCRKQFRLKIAS
jgi:hypothetical protein